MRVRVLAVLLVFGLALTGCGGGESPSITVMTRNLYLGADLNAVLEPEPGSDLLQAIDETWQTILASDFPARAEAIADEIAAASVDLVGLQEAMRYEVEEGEDLDFVQLVLDALADQDLDYELVVEQEQFGGAFPTSDGTVELTDRDAILVRTDGEVTIEDSSSGRYEAALEVPNPIPGEEPIRIIRGWTSVDATVDDVTFRVINTHLEAFDEESRNAQREELLAGPADTELPLIVVGDLNSRAPEGATYQAMLEADFVDAWVEADEGEDGFTSGWPDDLRGTDDGLTHRIDFVMYRDGFSTTDVDVVGEEPTDRVDTTQTPAGPLWPSDHAGVVATLELPEP